MLADRADIRQSFYSLSGRVAIMAKSEVTTSIPEHSNLDPYWNTRARGMGATAAQPISTGAEENVLCYGYPDKYREDIFMHELAHGLDNLGATYVIPNWKNRLQQTFDHAVSRGLWADTYAGSNPTEYFAEGVQSFFDVDDPTPAPGISNEINLQSELRTYDPELFNLLLEVFPCNNHYIKRCDKSRAAENSQQLRMDCGGGSAGSVHSGGGSGLVG
nr:hypothetical protein BaRGS_009740 [Batillaria attramentaria]